MEMMAWEGAGTGSRMMQVCIDLPALAQVCRDIDRNQPEAAQVRAELAHMPCGTYLPVDLGPLV